MTSYGASWTERCKITVESPYVYSTTSDFPVYVDLSGMPASFWNKVKSDGSDIVVTSSDGTTKLSRELVNISSSNQTGELYFKAPSISSSSDTEFYIHYGNSGATETNDTSTWSSAHLAVLHLDGDFTDSTSNSYDFTENGTGGSFTTGFDGTSNSAYDTGTGGWLTRSSMTVSTASDGGSFLFLVKDVSQGVGSFARPIVIEDSAGGGNSLQIYEDAQELFFRSAYSGNNDDQSGTISNPTNWHLIGGRAGPTSSGATEFVVDNVRVDVTFPRNFGFTDTTIRAAIGALYGGGNKYSAPFDEVRFYQGQIDDTVMRTTYNNLLDFANFITVGPAEPDAVDVTVLPSLVINASELLFSETVLVDTLITPSILSSADTEFAPSIIVDTSISPSIVTSTSVEFTPSIIVDTLLLPGLLTSTDATFAPSVVVDTIVSPILLQNSDTVFAPTLSLDTTIAPTLLVSGNETIFSATVTVDVLVSPDILEGQDVLFAPTVDIGAVGALYVITDSDVADLVIYKGDCDIVSYTGQSFINIIL